MNVLIFIIVLGILVFVHELGHFLFAKLFKIRVAEFGFGYPPRMIKIGSWRGTEITFNWIPFGGFVKIFGESDDGRPLIEQEKKVSLVHKPRWQQFIVMFGGILFNFIFAALLLCILYMSGIQSDINSAPQGYEFESTELVVSAVLADSPAQESGLEIGDEVKEYFNQYETVTVKDETIQDVSYFINQSGSEGLQVGMVVERNDSLETLEMTPREGLVPDRYGVGINMQRVGELKLPFVQSIIYGTKNTVVLTGVMFQGFWQLISGAISLDNVSGPIGIAGQVGQTVKLGFSYLIFFTALLSLNLAVLNLVPFPALDGGRIFIIIIESIVGRRLNPNIINWVNGIGFFLLIGLMIFVSVKDIINLF